MNDRDLASSDTSKPPYPRKIRQHVLDALSDTRVVLVEGARQVGKSTLMEEIAHHGHIATTVTLDDPATRSVALDDPVGFIADLAKPLCIDEVQRAPELLIAIKMDVDRNQEPGRYLLTGSANVVASRRVIDALTGRIETIRLWPLTQSEIHRSKGNIVDSLFRAEPPRVTDAPVGRSAFVPIVVAGGYPEAILRSGRRRDDWFASYVNSTLGSDLRELTDARKLAEMPRLLRHFASQAANIVSYRNISRNLGIAHMTVKDYIGLLETLFLVRLLPAWRPGIGSREMHAPKGYVVDSGLLAYLLGANEHRAANDVQVTGKLFENFVAMEILRHSDWAEIATTPYHYRQHNREIDLVLESRSGEVAGVEVKASASLHASDWRPLAMLRDRLGSRFQAGFVIHSGAQTLPLGDRLWAVPVSGLWA